MLSERLRVLVLQSLEQRYSDTSNVVIDHRLHFNLPKWKEVTHNYSSRSSTRYNIPCALFVRASVFRILSHMTFHGKMCTNGFPFSG